MEFRFPPSTEPKVGPVVSLEIWWDWELKLWTTQAYDANRNIVGGTLYDAYKKDAVSLAQKALKYFPHPVELIVQTRTHG